MIKLRKKKKPIINNNAVAKDFAEVHYELQTYSQVVKNMSDADLVDYLLPYQMQNYEMDDVLDCYVTVNQNRTLSGADRYKLEAYYLLLNTDLGFDV